MSAGRDSFDKIKGQTRWHKTVLQHYEKSCDNRTAVTKLPQVTPRVQKKALNNKVSSSTPRLPRISVLKRINSGAGLGCSNSSQYFGAMVLTVRSLVVEVPSMLRPLELAVRTGQSAGTEQLVQEGSGRHRLPSMLCVPCELTRDLNTSDVACDVLLQLTWATELVAELPVALGKHKTQGGVDSELFEFEVEVQAPFLLADEIGNTCLVRAVIQVGRSLGPFAFWQCSQYLTSYQALLKLTMPTVEFELDGGNPDRIWPVEGPTGFRMLPRFASLHVLKGFKLQREIGLLQITSLGFAYRFHEPLYLPCTLFDALSEGAFQTKAVLFELRYDSDTGPEERILMQAAFDISEHLSRQKQTATAQMDFVSTGSPCCPNEVHSMGDLAIELFSKAEQIDPVMAMREKMKLLLRNKELRSSRVIVPDAPASPRPRGVTGESLKHRPAPPETPRPDRVGGKASPFKTPIPSPRQSVEDGILKNPGRQGTHPILMEQRRPRRRTSVTDTNFTHSMGDEGRGRRSSITDTEDHLALEGSLAEETEEPDHHTTTQDGGWKVNVMTCHIMGISTRITDLQLHFLTGAPDPPAVLTPLEDAISPLEAGISPLASSRPAAAAIVRDTVRCDEVIHRVAEPVTMAIPGPLLQGTIHIKLFGSGSFDQPTLKHPLHNKARVCIGMTQLDLSEHLTDTDQCATVVTELDKVFSLGHSSNINIGLRIKCAQQWQGDYTI